MKNSPRKPTRKSRPKRRKSGGSLLPSWWGVLIGVLLTIVACVLGFWYFFISPTSFRWAAFNGKTDWPEGYEVVGIDISHHQANIDWDRLRNCSVDGQPIRFVIIKGTEGTDLFDENFNDNFHWARQNELVRGAYHFFLPDRDVLRQADFFLKQVHLLEGDLPPILDVELRGRKSLPEFRRDVLMWLRRIESVYGVKPILYTSYKFKEDYLNGSEFADYPLWVAHYEKNLGYKGEWIMWQFSDRGKVDGIRGMVDFDIFNGDLRALHDLTLHPNMEEPTE